MDTLQDQTRNATTEEIPATDMIAASNVRRDADRADIEAMKTSLLASGQLQNVCAARGNDGGIVVFAGGTRLQAANELVNEGKLPRDYALRALVFNGIDPDSPDAIAIAMTENVVRAQMDYIDECTAMEKLAESRRTEEEIAAIFGYRPKTVTERLLIAKLIPEAHALVRDKSRNLAWARALTLADKTFQKQITDDIASNPQAWATGEDIRKHLLQSTIPASHALFDPEDYTGEIISDMFDGDKLSDVEQFWTLQNAAIENLARDVEAEGYKEVVVTREPFQSWKYDSCDDVSQATAFIEVMPNGKVQVIRDLVSIEVEKPEIASLDAAEETSAAVIDEIADDEVRVTPSIRDYAAAHRTAMVQARMATDFRAAMEYTVLAMLGHRDTIFGIQAYTHPGKTENNIGRAFETMVDVSEAVHEQTAVNAPTPERRDIELTAMIRAMDDAALNSLFTMLVAQRAGQKTRRDIDDKDVSLMNAFGADIDIRAWWTPDETFFNLMGTSDLRRIAGALLPGASATRFASATKKDLVRALSNNFENARNGSLGNGEVAARLNAWVPGVLDFPAKIAMKSDEAGLFEESADAQDLEAAMFA